MLFALLALPSAQAYVFVGNPNLTVGIDRTEADLTGGQVAVSFVRVHRCGGGYDDYGIEATFDPTEGETIAIDPGDLCGVEVVWDDVGEVWSSAFSLKSNAAATSVTIAGSWSTAAWTPYTVASGTFSGSSPVVTIKIQ